MIAQQDFDARGWDVLSMLEQRDERAARAIREAEAHAESPGKSSVGTRNLLYSFALSMRPKVMLEVGAHIGVTSMTIGSALRANRFGRAYCLEPQDHYFRLLQEHVEKAGLFDHVRPLKLFSTDPSLPAIIGEPADIIYLDANHTYSHVMNDLEICDRMLAPGGVMFLDDTGAGHSAAICSEKKGGVRQALFDFVDRRKEYQMLVLDHPFWLNPCGIAIVSRRPAG